jgi:histidine triad (HIT) family protein
MKYISIFVFTLFALQLNATPCAFCNPEIVKKQLVFETESFNILLDYAPQVPGHLLVIPKRHLAKAHELSRDEWSELSDIIPKAVKVFSEFLNTDDYIILEKNGRNAFQQVLHVHFHLFPMHSEKPSDIFDTVIEPLSPEDLHYQVGLFRSYFNQIRTIFHGTETDKF